MPLSNPRDAARAGRAAPLSFRLPNAEAAAQVDAAVQAQATETGRRGQERPEQGYRLGAPSTGALRSEFESELAPPEEQEQPEREHS